MLNSIYKKSRKLQISDKSRIVIFSDLHIGNKSITDDFKKNSGLFTTILAGYRANDYTLILNGDIEELYKFSLSKILMKWKELYRMFQDFNKDNKLIKLFGNHDYSLLRKKKFLDFDISESITLKYKSDKIFIFHGHQANHFTEFKNLFSGFFVKYFALPLGIKNYSVAFNSKKKYKIEQKVYNFAKKKKIMAIIGHTHRPLFESLSKQDNLKFKIEELCRKYNGANINEKKKIERIIHKYSSELKETSIRKNRDARRSSLYSGDIHVPAIFNSGCTIGKNGITAIEISEGKIKLLYWFSKKRSEKYFNLNGYKPEQISDTDYYKVVLKSESLDYIFTKLKILN